MTSLTMQRSLWLGGGGIWHNWHLADFRLPAPGLATPTF